MWFVVHVKPGAEAQVADLLREAPRGGGLDEVFSPMAACMRLDHGRPVEGLVPVFSGCVFAVAPGKRELRAALRDADGVEGLIGQRPSFDAMEAGEGRFIDLLAAPGERVVELSEAVVDANGRMTIAGGPLKGREGDIRGHTERRRLAYLDASVAGRPARARVGLRVTRDDSLHPWEK